MEVSTKRWICSDICRRCNDPCRFAGYVGEDEEEMGAEEASMWDTDSSCGCRNGCGWQNGCGCRNGCGRC